MCVGGSVGVQKALAFTKEQYDLAESLTKTVSMDVLQTVVASLEALQGVQRVTS